MLPNSMAARRQHIVELLAANRVKSQAELRGLLVADGIDVTQATLSRDLDELRAIKISDSTGEAVYAVPDEGGSEAASIPDDAATTRARLARIGAELISSVDYSGNNVMLRTPPGAAQYVASAIDHTVIPGIIGTIAGDDTILLVTKEADGGQAVAEQLLELVNSKTRT